MFIMGISGGTASGKTSMVAELSKVFHPNEVAIIAQDHYYKDTSHLSREERKQINFDHPNAIDFDLLTAHLKALRSGQAITRPTYSFITHNRTVETVHISPCPLFIIEGILILSQPQIRALLDLKVFIDVEADIRFIRRLERDISERGRTMEQVVQQYTQTLKPMHDSFIAPSKVHADLVLTNQHSLQENVDLLQKHIRKCMG